MFIDMNNPIFINQLTDLSKNRFALDTLSNEQFFEFYQTLLSNFNIHAGNNWYLIGTDGCHLCDVTKSIIEQASCLGSLPILHNLDLAEANDTGLLVDTLGIMIPVILTPSHLLCYPFGVMDVVNLAKTSA